MVRNAYGILATVTVAAAVALVTWRGSSRCRPGGPGTPWPGSCCSGGSGRSWTCSAPAAGGRASRSDADQLAALTGMPGGVWVALFALVALGALVVSGFWLIY